MATSAIASAVFPLPIDEVWAHLQSFTFPKTLLSSIIESVELEEPTKSSVHHKNAQFDGRTVGVVRKIVWRTGEMRKHRLLGLSDQYHFLTWELIEADPPLETSAILSKIRCFRVSETNETVVEWSAEYGSDVPPAFVLFEQRSFQENLIEMRSQMTGTKLPILYHMNEAASSRVLWLANELGIPLRVKEVVSQPTDLRKSRETEVSMDKGGIVTSYFEPDNNLVLLESGAIVAHLLEKHDKTKRLTPSIGSTERALFHQYFFYSASTADHLLIQAYKLMYVLDEGESGEETVRTLRNQWDDDVARNFSKVLDKHTYICGERFTGADIMVGWTLYIANLLGWLDNHPSLHKYFQTLAQRSAFVKVFNSYQY